MPLNKIKPDLVRYEMRMVQGVNPHEKEQKRPGAFGRFLSGAGRVLGSVAMPLSFIFPPAAIAAAGMYGVGAIGDQAQGRAYGRAYEKMMRERATAVSFPGLEFNPSPIQPAAAGMSAGDSEVMRVLDARGHAMTDMSDQI